MNNIKLSLLFTTIISLNLNAQGYQYSTNVQNWGSAFGGGTTATGWHSFAVNYQTQATSSNTFASGYQSVASGDTSTALGFVSQASGTRSVAIGSYSTASNTVSIAIGHNVTASGLHSVGMGISTTASGSYSTAIGDLTTASGRGSTSMGQYNTASARASTAMGNNITASDFASLVIGQFNSSGSSVTNSATEFTTANTAFVIGNGADASNKSDAFKVMFNGDTTVSNDLTVNGDVVVSSDARIKSNIVSLGSTLSRLLLIDGKSYTMTKDGKQKIGVLAQEIKEVFPELVSEDDNEMLAVNYQGLVPVLINAIKEQNNKISNQQFEIDRLKEQEKRLERLEKLVTQLD
jgi:hypothetical protein